MNQFFNLFVQVLKRPNQVSEQTNASLMGSGFIAMALFSLLIPLVIYFDIKTFVGGDDVPFTFGEAVLQPFVMLLVVCLLVNVFIFFALKLGNVVIGFKDVIARFGAFMIPSVAILLVGFLLAVMGVNPTFVLCLFGLAIFAWIAAIGSTIYSYKQAHTGGLDPFYGVLATITAAFLVIYLFRDVLLGDFIEGLMGIALNLVFRKFFGGF